MDRVEGCCTSLLRGCGQVMFMPNWIAGALFLAGIVAGSWLSGAPLMAVGAVAGLAVSTFVAHAFRLGMDEGEQGLWGFNGILVGCALPAFLEHSWVMWGALVVLAGISPFLRLWMNRAVSGLGINSLTFPFIVLTWMSFLLPRLATGDGTALVAIDVVTIVEAWLNGFSQVFLVCSPICGALFVLGLLVADRRAAMWGAAGSAIGIALAFACQQDSSAIVNGLYGFNPLLTAIALGAVFRRSTATVIVGIIATFFVQMGMSWLLSYVGLPALTAPFCLATWLSLTVCPR